MKDAGDLVLVEDFFDEVTVANIAFEEVEAGVLVGTDEVLATLAGGEVVEDGEVLDGGVLKELTNEGGANEACAAGDEKGGEFAHRVEVVARSGGDFCGELTV